MTFPWETAPPPTRDALGSRLVELEKENERLRERVKKLARVAKFARNLPRCQQRYHRPSKPCWQCALQNALEALTPPGGGS